MIGTAFRVQNQSNHSKAFVAPIKNLLHYFFVLIEPDGTALRMLQRASDIVASPELCPNEVSDIYWVCRALVLVMHGELSAEIRDRILHALNNFFIRNSHCYPAYIRYVRVLKESGLPLPALDAPPTEAAYEAYIKDYKDDLKDSRTSRIVEAMRLSALCLGRKQFQCGDAEGAFESAKLAMEMVMLHDNELEALGLMNVTRIIPYASDAHSAELRKLQEVLSTDLPNTSHRAQNGFDAYFPLLFARLPNIESNYAKCIYGVSAYAEDLLEMKSHLQWCSNEDFSLLFLVACLRGGTLRYFRYLNQYLTPEALVPFSIFAKTGDARPLQRLFRREAKRRFLFYPIGPQRADSLIQELDVALNAIICRPYLDLSKVDASLINQYIDVAPETVELGKKAIAAPIPLNDAFTGEFSAEHMLLCVKDSPLMIRYSK